MIHFFHLKIDLKSGASEVICKNLATPAVEHYYNSGTGGRTVGYIDTTNPTIGITGASLTVDSNNNIVCTYTRANSNSNANYVTISSTTPLYVLVAYGTTTNGGIF